MTDLPKNMPAEVGDSENELNESNLLLGLYRAIIEAHDLPSGLRAALEIVCRLTGWAVGTAWLPSADGVHIPLYAFWHGEAETLLEFVADCQRQTFSRNIGIAGRVWHTGKPEWTCNLAAESVSSFPLSPLAAKAGLQAAFGVPITHDGHVNGVLVFHARERKDRDDDLIEIIARIATQLGFAVQHKRLAEEQLQRQNRVERRRDLLEEAVARRTSELDRANQMLTAEISARETIADALQSRARQQEAVAELGRSALRGAGLSALMQTVTELATKTLEVEFCKVLERLPRAEGLFLRAGVGWQDGTVGRAIVTADMNSQAGYTLLCKEPVIVSDLRTETRFSGPPLLLEHGIVSGISVIIGPAERPFGVLGAHTAKPRQFSKDDVNFLQSVANLLFQAIEQSRAMEDVRRNATWLERLIETTQDAVVSIDRRGCIVLFNPAAERLFGYRAAEIVGRKVNDLMAEPYATEHDSYIERYEKTGEARAIGRIRTVEARRKNGEVFPIELSVTQVATAETEDVHYAAFIRDISEVRRGQAWVQSLIETTQDAVLSIDRQGHIVLFNPAAERIFGYARSEIIGKKVNLLMAEPYASEHDDYIARYERTGQAKAIGRLRTVTARRKSGEPFPIELSVTEVAADQDVHYAAFIRDISEKIDLQSQLLERERLATIGSTAAKIGHELANPLNGMSLTAQLLEHRIGAASEGLAAQLTPTVLRLKNEITRLQRLVGEFSEMSRKEKYVFVPVQLGELIEDVIELQRPHLAQSRVAIEVSFIRDLPTVMADGDKIKQAILNLVKNAVDAMPEGGKISIEAFINEDTLVLEVADTGQGIPLDIDPFQPFVTTKKSGTGVGLMVVRQILTAHRGKIYYRSTPGKGTTFRVELPHRQPA